MNRLCLIFSFVLSAAAQDVPRPKWPSAETMASATSQIKAWALYAEDCEKQIAALKAKLATAPSGTLEQILAKVTVLEAAVGTVKVWVLSGQTQATIAWDAVPNASGYKVERSTDMVNYALLITMPGASLTYVDKPLTSGAYWYRIRAYNGEMVSVPSNIASITLK